MIPRTLFQSLNSAKKSILLLGPRQTGKSTLIKSLRPDVEINLIHEATFLQFTRNPLELEQRLSVLKSGQSIFIDEVQRMPSLLNTIQEIVDNDSRKLKFFLTGSSARKLKRGNANLLPGRIFVYSLGGICSRELGHQLDTASVMQTGTLPGILMDEDLQSKTKLLRSYAGTYLKEEIQAESLTKNIEGFSRFLYVAANESGNLLNINKLASSAQISRQSATRFFEILEDTLIFQRVAAYSGNHRSRLVKHPKYYLFDVGVLNALLENFVVSEDRKGRLFENLFCNQLFNSAFALDLPLKVMSLRTEAGSEVDFIVELKNKLVAIELKASMNISDYDLRGLKQFRSMVGRDRPDCYLAYLGTIEKEIDGIRILPWQKVLQAIGL